MALEPCNECEKSISTDAKRCPNCGKKAPHRKSVTLHQIAIALSVFIAYLLAIYTTPQFSSSAPAASTNTAHQNVEAVITCQDAIKQMAKYANSVEFPWNGGFQVRQDKSGNIVIIQDFTAMNSFGAKLPQQGTCRFQKNGRVKVTIADN